MFGRDLRPERISARPVLAIAFALVLTAQAVSPVAAAAGELDDTFDGNGKLTLNTSAGDDYLWDLVIQPGDQKIVAVGRSGEPGDAEWVLVRFNPDGSLDSAFGGGDGLVFIDFSSGEDNATSVALQADGKIVVVGRASGSGGRWGIARFNTDGTLDDSFSSDGKKTVDFSSSLDFAWDVAIQEDQQIVVAGYAAAADARFTAVRFNSNGTLDTTFSGDGVATANLTSGVDTANSVALQANGKIVLAGYASGSGGQVGLARLRTNGNLDTSFSGDGKLTKNFTSASDLALDAAIQPGDGKIVLSGVAGGSNSKVVALRYNSDGTPDSTFSGNGNLAIDITSFTDLAYDLALQDDGKIVLAGSANYEFFTVIRLNTTGTLDTSFGDDGTMFANITADYDVGTGVAVQADGNIVVVGSSAGSGGRISAARFLGV